MKQVTDKRILPTLDITDIEAEILPSKIQWGCIATKYVEHKLKDGGIRRYGPYAYHVTKLPPDFSSRQNWDYIGKVGSERYNEALAWLRENPLLPDSKNPTVRVGKYFEEN